MELQFWDIAIILLYLFCTVAIGFYISRKASKDIKSYFLGGNNINWWMLGFSNSAGMFDVSGTAWMVSMVFIYGVNVYWQQWAWPVWNQVIMMSFLAVWLRRSNVMTGAEWINFRFGKDRGASASHLITVIFAVLVAVAFIAYMTVGIGQFATTILPWDLSFTINGLLIGNEKVYATIIILLTTIYSIKGGMYSVVATEILQYVILVACCILMAYLAMSMVSKETIDQFFPQGWKQLALKARIDLDWNSKWPAINKTIDDSGFRNFGFVFGVMAFKGIWSSLAGPVPSYDMQRVLSTKSAREAAKMNAFTMLVLYIPLYLMVASVLVLGVHYFTIADLTNIKSGLPRLEAILGMVVSQLPVGVKGLLLAGLLAAFMSTFSAFVNSGPAYIVNDIYRKYIRPGATQKKLVRVSYISCALIMLVGLSIGLGISNISTMFDIITGGLYAGFVVPNVLKWIWWRLNGWGYFAGMMTGIAVSLWSILYWNQLTHSHIVLSFPLNMALSLAAAVFTSFATRRQQMDSLTHFYTTTLPWGFWKPVRSKVQLLTPAFQPNKDFKRDVLNVVIGIIWQMSMIIMPIYFVLKEFNTFFFWVVIWLACMLALRFTWWKYLPEEKT